MQAAAVNIENCLNCTIYGNIQQNNSEAALFMHSRKIKLTIPNQQLSNLLTGHKEWSWCKLHNLYIENKATFVIFIWFSSIIHYL